MNDETCERCGARILRAESGWVTPSGDAQCPEGVFHLPAWPDPPRNPLNPGGTT